MGRCAGQLSKTYLGEWCLPSTLADKARVVCLVCAHFIQQSPH